MLNLDEAAVIEKVDQHFIETKPFEHFVRMMVPPKYDTATDMWVSEWSSAKYPNSRDFKLKTLWPNMDPNRRIYSVRDLDGAISYTQPYAVQDAPEWVSFTYESLRSTLQRGRRLSASKEAFMAKCSQVSIRATGKDAFYGLPRKISDEYVNSLVYETYSDEELAADGLFYVVMDKLWPIMMWGGLGALLIYIGFVIGFIVGGGT